jgi:hypothetical protein
MEPVDCAGDDVGPGHPAGKRSQPRRPVFTSCAAVENSRKRNFLGSQRRVSLASARETISSQIRWSEQERAARELLDRFGVDMDLHRPLGDAMGIRSRCLCSNAVRYVQRPATT